MSAFTEAALEKKLSELSNSQQSVQTLSLWLIHHRKHSRTIVNVWFNELKKGKLSLTWAPDCTRSELCVNVSCLLNGLAKALLCGSNYLRLEMLHTQCWSVVCTVTAAEASQLLSNNLTSLEGCDSSAPANSHVTLARTVLRRYRHLSRLSLFMLVILRVFK